MPGDAGMNARNCSENGVIYCCARELDTKTVEEKRRYDRMDFHERWHNDTAKIGVFALKLVRAFLAFF